MHYIHTMNGKRSFMKIKDEEIVGLDLSKYLDKSSIFYEKLIKIYTENDSIPKKVIVGRNLHHKKLRSWSRLDKEQVDNTLENLVSLSFPDHILAHYYIYKCAKKPYLASAARAWWFMSKNLLREGILTEDVEDIVNTMRGELGDAYLAWSTPMKGRKPSNFETFRKACAKYWQEHRISKEEAKIKRQEYYENVIKPKKKELREENAKITCLRCIEFDEVHTIINWRRMKIRADKEDYNLSDKGLHFERVYELKYKWKEPDVSDGLLKYLDTWQKNHWKKDKCDCCGAETKGLNHVSIKNGFTLCYLCMQSVSSLELLLNNKEEHLNPNWVAFYSRFLILRGQKQNGIEGAEGQVL